MIRASYVIKREQDEKLMSGLLDKLQQHSFQTIVEGVEDYIRELATYDDPKQFGRLYPQMRLMQALGLAGLDFYADAFEVVKKEAGRITFSGGHYVTPRDQPRAILDFVLTLQLGLHAHAAGQQFGSIMAVVDYARLVDNISENGAGNQNGRLYGREHLIMTMERTFGSGSGIELVRLTLEKIIAEAVAGREVLQTAVSGFGNIEGYEFPGRSVSYPTGEPPIATMDGISVRLAVWQPGIVSIKER